MTLDCGPRVTDPLEGQSFSLRQSFKCYNNNPNPCILKETSLVLYCSYLYNRTAHAVLTL